MSADGTNTLSRMREIKVRPSSFDIRVQQIVMQARTAANAKHGELKGGMGRWAHHLGEECEEAIIEMDRLGREVPGARGKLLVELAQVAQLAERMIGMLLDGKEWEEADTWRIEEMGMGAEI